MSAAKEKRYCFMKDNDGHSYLVPFELNGRFIDVLDECSERDKWIKFEAEFGNMRLHYHPNCYSFTDPKLIDRG